MTGASFAASGPIVVQDQMSLLAWLLMLTATLVLIFGVFAVLVGSVSSAQDARANSQETLVGNFGRASASDPNVLIGVRQVTFMSDTCSVRRVEELGSVLPSWMRVSGSGYIELNVNERTTTWVRTNSSGFDEWVCEVSP